jgi:hypothetical protein
MDRTFELVIKDSKQVVEMQSMQVDVLISGFLSGNYRI